jgi:hypothetical protein
MVSQETLLRWRGVPCSGAEIDEGISWRGSDYVWVSCLKGRGANRSTDNPFFPPLTGDPGETEWESVRTNVEAAKSAFTEDEFMRVMGGNAIEILGLD